MLLLVTALSALTGFAPSVDMSRDKPTVAIVDFEATPGGSTIPPPYLGATVAQLLVDKLVGVAPFHIVDGRWLQPPDSLRDRRQAMEMLRAAARDARVDYLVFGSVTRLSMEQRQRTVGGGGFRLPLIGGYRRQTSETVVSLWVSIVDVWSGEIVATTTADGRGTRRQRGLGATGFLRAAGGLGGSSGSTGFRDALLDEAVREAVAAAAEDLVSAAPRMTVVHAEHQP